MMDAEASTKSGKWLDVKVIAIEDAYLSWWFSSSDGHDLDYLIRLHICAGPFSECRKVVPERHEEFHADVVRKIDLEDIRKNCEAWWTRSDTKTRYAEWRKIFLEEAKDADKSKRKKPPSEDVGLSTH